MHGTKVNATLETAISGIGRRSPGRKFITHWIKLTRLGLNSYCSEDSPSAGPERRVFVTTAEAMID